MDENMEYIFDPRGWRTPEGGWVPHSRIMGMEARLLRAESKKLLDKADFIDRWCAIMDEASIYF